MAPFKKSPHRGASAGPRTFSRDARRPSFGRGPSEEREMFSATCNKCREACEVPFRPNGKRPVYCRNCFVRDDEQAFNPREKREFGAARSFSRPSSSEHSRSEDSRISAIQKEIGVINAKLDELLARLEG